MTVRADWRHRCALPAWLTALVFLAGGSAVTSAPDDRRPVSTLPSVSWFGGPAYYGSFAAATAAGWTSPAFFPLGVWYEGLGSTADVDADRRAGLNTYFYLTGSSDAALARAAGQSVVHGLGLPNEGAETVGDFLWDEADMAFGAGTDTWNGDVPWPHACTPSSERGGRCGFTAMRTLAARLPAADGRFRWANYGKGVLFWDTDADAARFVNDYTDAVSSDAYWYSDTDVCAGTQGGLLLARAGHPGSGPIDANSAGVLPEYPRGVPALTDAECHRAYNYGLLIDRLRHLDEQDGERQPIYAFVEDGCPMTNGRCITGPQLAGAVLSSLIHGANGVIYFNHSFSGPCPNQHNLRATSCSADTIAAVTRLNAQLTTLAPVLNSPTLTHRFGTGLDTMLKQYDGSLYVFAMGVAGTTGVRSFTLPTGVAARSVEVVGEQRTLPVRQGRFADRFEHEYSYHVYRVTPPVA